MLTMTEPRAVRTRPLRYGPSLRDYFLFICSGIATFAVIFYLSVRVDQLATIKKHNEAALNRIIANQDREEDLVRQSIHARNEMIIEIARAVGVPETRIRQFVREDALASPDLEGKAPAQTPAPNLFREEPEQ